MKDATHIREMIVRLARLEAAGSWDGDLNPAQRAALSYLSKANRFSRSPSHIADYLGTTRGTTSQSLKALVRKGYLTEYQSESDRRSISFSLTRSGTKVAQTESQLDTAIAALSEKKREALSLHLKDVLRSVVATTSGQSFGICKDCVYHQLSSQSAFCKLLELPLEPSERDQICVEQIPA